MGHSGAAPSVAELVRLLADQREALLQRGTDASERIEACSRKLEAALAGFAAADAAAAAGRLPEFVPTPSQRLSAAELARLQDELQATQATLSRLAAGNRRALDTLFGEASLYSR
jgi:hypothetical protein